MKTTGKKEQAINLRKKGYSYKLIIDKIGTSKSTLSAWLKNVPFEANKEVQQRIKAGPLKSGITSVALKIK